jgi:hypothetical protein
VYGVPNSSEYQGWCISNTDPQHWNNYAKDSDFYFYIRKRKRRDDYDKIAASVTADSVTYFDMQDKELDEFPAENEPNVDFEEPEIKIEVNGNLMPLSQFQNSKNLKVGGDLNLYGTQIKSLPAGLEVGGDLNLIGTPITSLPAGLEVGGDLYLYGTQITSLPAGLEVGGILDLSDTPITSLPADLKVGGGLNLSDTKITSLPADLEVGGNLYLSGTKIKDIPEHLKKKVIR